MKTDSPTATVKSLTPPEVADRLRTIDLRAGYIIGACKDTREMRLEAEEIKRLVVETFKGLRAWWHGDMAQSAIEQSNAAPQGGLANAGDHDSGGSDDASVMGAAPASAAPSEAGAFEQPDFMTEAQKAAYWFDLYLEETAKRRKLERERNAWEAKFNAECEKHDATTLRAMKAERDLALALDHIEKDDKEIERHLSVPEAAPAIRAGWVQIPEKPNGAMLALMSGEYLERPLMTRDQALTVYNAILAQARTLLIHTRDSRLPQNEKHG